jgi:hypothetical protein
VLYPPPWRFPHHPPPSRRTSCSRPLLRLLRNSTHPITQHFRCYSVSSTPTPCLCICTKAAAPTVTSPLPSPLNVTPKCPRFPSQHHLLHHRIPYYRRQQPPFKQPRSTGIMPKLTVLTRPTTAPIKHSSVALSPQRQRRTSKRSVTLTSAMPR